MPAQVSFDFGEIPPAKAELPPLEAEGLASPLKRLALEPEDGGEENPASPAVPASDADD